MLVQPAGATKSSAAASPAARATGAPRRRRGRSTADDVDDPRTSAKRGREGSAGTASYYNKDSDGRRDHTLALTNIRLGGGGATATTTSDTGSVADTLRLPPVRPRRAHWGSGTPVSPASRATLRGGRRDGKRPRSGDSRRTRQRWWLGHRNCLWRSSTERIGPQGRLHPNSYEPEQQERGDNPLCTLLKCEVQVLLSFITSS